MGGGEREGHGEWVEGMGEIGGQGWGEGHGV